MNFKNTNMIIENFENSGARGFFKYIKDFSNIANVEKTHGDRFGICRFI